MTQANDPTISAAAEAQELASAQRNVRLESFKGFSAGALSALPMNMVRSVLIGGVATALAAVAAPFAGVASLAVFLTASGASLAVGSTMAGAGAAEEHRRRAQFHNISLRHAKMAIEAGADPTQTLLSADERRQLDHPVTASLIEASRQVNPVHKWASRVSERLHATSPDNAHGR